MCFVYMSSFVRPYFFMNFLTCNLYIAFYLVSKSNFLLQVYIFDILYA